MTVPEIYIILHNIRSLHNVGSIFRTADGAGVQKIFLTGYTPLPVDRFGKMRKEFSKTSLGAEKNIHWQHYKNIKSLLKKLSSQNVKIFSIEQSSKSKNYLQIKIVSNTAFIFGNEVRGLSKSVLEYSDEIFEIPMHGKKESLNVSVSVGIIMFKVVEKLNS